VERKKKLYKTGKDVGKPVMRKKGMKQDRNRWQEK